MARTVFLGFDAMDSHLVRTWASEGKLPNLAGVIDSWGSATTLNPVGLLVGGLWPSFWSQSGPAHHGSYCWRQVVNGTYTTALVVPTDLDNKPFWLGLDQQGVRCAILDVPLVPPFPLEHGVSVVDWGSHDSQLPLWVSSTDAAARLASLGPYPQRRCDATVESQGHEQLLADIVEGVRLRTAMLRMLLEGDAEFVATVFSESHCAGHHLYHLHDPEHIRHDAALAARLGEDPLLTAYRRIDDALGELLSTLLPDTAVMVLLSHGIGPHYDGNPMLDEILKRIEHRRQPVPAWVRARESVLRPVRGVGRRIDRLFRPDRRRLPSLRNLDGSRAWFEVPSNDLHGAIRLNLRGREPRGRMRPGAETDATIALLTEELLLLRHTESGGPAVTRVLRTDDYHRGPRRGMLPDLLVEWNWSVPFRSLTSPTIGTVSNPAVPQRTGDHRPHGEVFVRNLVLPANEQIPVESLADVLVSDVLARR